jgi:hypothetical protein
MTNPAQAIRMLVTYAIIVPLAALVGWLLCNPLDYGTLGFFGIVALLLASPFFIKYHYPFLFFALTCPATCFFLVGRPPLWQAGVILSLGISVIDRTLNSEKRFISVPVMTWPLLYTAAVVYFTAEMTGGIGLHALGGDTGGGKKYISIFLGIATFFALASQRIPAKHRNLYVALCFLPGALGAISDLFPYLPSPLNYINLLFPPSLSAATGINVGASTRLAAVGGALGVFVTFMLAKYGLRGIMDPEKPFRLPVFMVLFCFSLVGGFRNVLLGYLEVFVLLFFMERLYRTRLSLVVVLGVVMVSVLAIPFSDKLPHSMQRAMSFIPGLKIDPDVLAEAEGSRQWRENMWRDVWPKVPQYLLMGKGYALSREDYNYMGGGAFESLGSLDQSQVGLAISGDYHSGPLSTLMPFGIWGAISFIWISLAALYVLYRNYLYGDQELKAFNRYCLVFLITGIIGFLFIFGAYAEVIDMITRIVGISVALNWGMRGPKPVPASNPAIRALPRPSSRPHPMTA